MKAPNLTTEDLILRPSVFEDLNYFYEWEQQPAVTEFFSIRDGQTLEEVTRKFMADSDDPSAMQLTICLKDGTPIGRIVMGTSSKDGRQNFGASTLQTLPCAAKAMANRRCRP